MSTYKDIAWPKELARHSRRQAVLWTTASLVMVSAHAGAAWLLTRQPPVPMIQEAGSGAIEVDIAALGFSAADQVSAGTTSEAVEPTTADAVEPVETAAQAQPVETPAAEQEQVQPVAPAAPSEAPVEPTEPSQTTAVPVQPPETAEPVETEAVESEALPVQPSEVPVETAQPSEVAVETAQPSEVAVETAPAVEEREELSALADVPIPTPRPAYTPPPPPPVREQPRQQQAARPAPPQGSSGQNETDSQRGVAEGQAAARAAPTGQAAQPNAAGNAAVSNYPGQVAGRLRRSLRYPREAQRQGLRGEVHVQFTVAASGQVTAVGIARSSGSPVLDQAALQTVQRAAPFPAIPAGAGRNSWPFTVPLSFQAN